MERTNGVYLEGFLQSGTCFSDVLELIFYKHSFIFRGEGFITETWLVKSVAWQTEGRGKKMSMKIFDLIWFGLTFCFCLSLVIFK